MSFLGDTFGFEKFKLGNMWDKIKDQPERLLIGGENPFSAKVASAVTGKDYEPLVDEWGGATKDDYEKAEARGINTNSGKKMHGVARAVAGIFVGKYGAGKAGFSGSADGGTGQGTGINKFGMGQGGSMPQMDFGSDTEHDVYVPEAAPVNVIDMDPIEDNGSAYIVSDRKRKKPAKGGVQRALQRGLDGENPIDQNGVQVLLIQALADRVEQLQKRVRELKRARGG